jgi:hypothetical protein
MIIGSYLSIAGIAHRRIIEAESARGANKSAFPKGPDDLHLVQEIAVCEAIIGNARALLCAQMLQLEFSSSGRALARVPEALRGGEYDRGSEDEPI